MTEEEWLLPGKLRESLKYLRRQPGDRKLRLFLCRCCRGVWHHLGDQCRSAIETAERFADGLTSQDELAAARARAKIDRKCYGVYFAYAPRPTFADVASSAEAVARFASVRTLDVFEREDDNRSEAEREFQRHILRDLFGNPFRPVSVDFAWLSWNNDTIPKLAQGIYADLAFDRLPILADALEDAGCDNADILAHCRQPGEHVRGCWVVDLLLGKS